MKPTAWVACGAVLGFLAVAFGAFGAHALAQRLSERDLAIFKTGCEYQMYHALALVGLGLWALARPASAALVQSAGWCFLIGTLVFSGSLYALTLSGIRWLGAITPIGGTLFLAGWLSWAWSAFSATREP